MLVVPYNGAGSAGKGGSPIVPANDCYNQGRYHFIGIGGYGMSALAQILLQSGCAVSGSDVKPSERTERLASMGALVHIGHDPHNLDGAQRVVYSTDVPSFNPELAEARARGLTVMHRSEVLAELMNERYGIAVSGSHGKTTVTSMITLLLERGGLDPTAVIGADVGFLNGNARLGRSRYLVAEADESDGSFVRYHPAVAVATNIDPEHLDRYGGSFENLLAAFRRFIGQTRELAVLCADDAHLREMRRELPVETLTYGLAPDAELRAVDIAAGRGETAYTAVWQGEELGRVTLVIPGEHNVVNSLAALAVGRHLGVDFPVAAQALHAFRGAKRRFQVLGQPGGITVVDDYAHHPTEIAATLKAARERAAGRVIAVFQPQRYVRTHLLLKEFSEAFGRADEIVLTDIYSPPGEQPIPGVSSQVLAGMISRHENRDVAYIPGHKELVDHLVKMVRPGDLVLTMGAGDIWKVAYGLVGRLESAHEANRCVR